MEGRRENNLLFVKIGYTKNLTAAKKSTKYIAFRSREGEKGAFDKDNDYADVKVFNKSLNDVVIAHPECPKIYKVVISLSEDEYKKTGLNYKDFIRESMSGYEAFSGKKLTWIAAEHMNCNHPHIHLSIKAAYEDKNGYKTRLSFNKYEFSQFKNYLIHNYENSISYKNQYTRFIEKEKISIKKILYKNVKRVLVRGNSTIFSMYGIYSLIKLRINKENIQRYKEYVKWIKTKTYGNIQYADFKKLLYVNNQKYNSINIDVKHTDRRHVSDYLNSKGLKWQAIENDNGTRVMIYPFDKNKEIIKTGYLKGISNTLNKNWRVK